jgi:hypothetical protein
LSQVPRRLLVSEGLLISGIATNVLEARSLQNGALVWRVPLLALLGTHSTGNATQVDITALAVDGHGTLGATAARTGGGYVGAVFSLELATGAPRWKVFSGEAFELAFDGAGRLLAWFHGYSVIAETAKAFDGAGQLLWTRAAPGYFFQGLVGTQALTDPGAYLDTSSGMRAWSGVAPTGRASWLGSAGDSAGWFVQNTPEVICEECGGEQCFPCTGGPTQLEHYLLGAFTPDWVRPVGSFASDGVLTTSGAVVFATRTPDLTLESFDARGQHLFSCALELGESESLSGRATLVNGLWVMKDLEPCVGTGCTPRARVRAFDTAALRVAAGTSGWTNRSGLAGQLAPRGW